MTDNAVTDVDLRNARLWANDIIVQAEAEDRKLRYHTAARVILATVEAPALSEELSRIAEGWEEWTTCAIDEALAAATTRAEQMEHELAEDRAEVERLTDVNETLRRTDNFKEFREQFLPVQKGAESNTESIDPADVKQGEAWLVRYRNGTLPALRRIESPGEWYIVRHNGTGGSVRSQDIALVTRLVPEPRVITNPDELDQLAVGTIIRAKDGEACRKSDIDDWTVDGLDGALGYGPRQVLPATVLWEPEA